MFAATQASAKVSIALWKSMSTSSTSLVSHCSTARDKHVIEVSLRIRTTARRKRRDTTVKLRAESMIYPYNAVAMARAQRRPSLSLSDTTVFEGIEKSVFQ